MPTDSRSPVTVLGLGAMGRALAGAFLNAGFRTTVWNRTASKADALVARGAVHAATAAEAVAASPLTVVCLLDDASVREVLGSAADALTGRTLVNLTNGTPRQAREMAAWAGEHGARYVDGGIMAVPSMIGGDGALVLYSGDGDAFATHRDALGALGAARYLGTDPGHAALYDIALLSAMYGMFGGALHALAIIRAAGESATEFAPLLISWLTAMTGSVPELAKGADSGEHSSGGSDLAMQAAAYPNLLASSADLGVSTELMEPMRVLLERGVAAGHGHDGLSALVGLLLPASRS